MPRKKPITLEKQVKHEIRKILDAMKIWYYMPPASVYGQRGIPDFVCCVRGKFVGIEAKSPKKGVKGLTPLQLMQQRKIIENNGEYIIVHDLKSLEDMKKKLEWAEHYVSQHHWLRGSNAKTI